MPATAYYQKALELRPKAVAVQNNLGLILASVGCLDDNANGRLGPGAISVLRKALRTDPDFAPARNNLGVCLKRAGIWWVAVHEYQDAVRADPDLATAHFGLGEMDAGSGRTNDAIAHYREALRVDPDFARAHYFFGIALLGLGRRNEVDEDYPESVESLHQFRGPAVAEAIGYYWKAYECAPDWVVARNSLHISLQDRARLDEAIGHFRQAILLEPAWFRSHGALALVLLATWQFAEADAALGRGLELLPSNEKAMRGNLEHLREHCRKMQVLESRLTAVVQGTDNPGTTESLDLAKLSFVKKHFVTAARLFASALAANPQLNEDLRASHRFNAACAAALAGGRHGDDAAKLGKPETARLRKQAREWLHLDIAAWAKKMETGTQADRIQARRTLSLWQSEPDLSGLRDKDALENLPVAEQRECGALWQELAALLK
jgi:tetratricopeptide (TPR) repeat protein